MKYICGVIGIVLTACVLASCAAEQPAAGGSESAYSADAQSAMAESTKESAPVPDDDSTVEEAQEPEAQEPETAANVYEAANQSGFIEEADQATCVLMCQNACEEFMRAKRQNELPDFSAYIENPNLLEYMNYKVKYYPHNFEVAHCVLKDAEFSAEDGYACLTGIVSDGQSAYGTVTFLLKNDDGRIWITEWYSCVLDYLDYHCDGRNADDYSVKDNADFWDDPDKYGPVLDQLRSRQD